MAVMSITLNGDGAWPDLKEKQAAGQVIYLDDDQALMVAALDRGMQSGLPSVAFRFELPDGRTVIAQTSARLFVNAGRAIAAKWPEVLA